MSAVLTVIAALLVAVVPGGLLALALPPGRERVLALTAAPALTLGLTAAGMAWLPVLGLPDAPWAVLTLSLILAGAVSGAAALVRRRRGEPRAGSVLPDWRDLLALAPPTVAILALARMLLGALGEPPGWDAMYHAFFVRRMLDVGTTQMDVICSTGSTLPATACRFYPLAADTLWAQAVWITDGRVSTSMMAWAQVLAPVTLVVGIYAVARHLGASRLVAMAASAAPAFVGPTWTSLRTGRLTEQAAPAMAIAVAMLLALAVRGRHPAVSGALAAIATAGILMSHTYDVLYILPLALTIVPLLSSPRSARDSVIGIGTGVAVGALALAPIVPALLGARGERTPVPPSFVGELDKAVSFWFTEPNRYIPLGYPPPLGTWVHESAWVTAATWVTAAALALSTLSLVLRELRWARPWWVAGAVWTVVGFLTSMSSSPSVGVLTSLWYNVKERIRNMIMPTYGVLMVAGAVALAVVLSRLARRFFTRAATGPAPAWAVGASALTVVAFVGAVALQPSTRDPIRRDFIMRTAYGTEYDRAFRWLADHIGPGEVVATAQNLEFGPWVYADYGVDTLFGLEPLEVASVLNYENRERALSWLLGGMTYPAGTTGPPAATDGCQVQAFNVRYVLLGKRKMPAWPRTYSPSRVETTGRLAVVERFGDLRILGVTDLGRSCG